LKINDDDDDDDDNFAVNLCYLPIINILYCLESAFVSEMKNAKITTAASVATAYTAAARDIVQKRRATLKLMPNTHRRRRGDETVLSLRRRRCERN